MWSLKALAGIFEPEPGRWRRWWWSTELVELQAVPASATSTTTPAAAIRVFHDADRNAPPRTRCDRGRRFTRVSRGRPAFNVTLRQKLGPVSSTCGGGRDVADQRVRGRADRRPVGPPAGRPGAAGISG